MPSGFTLVEVVVALGLFALAVGLGLGFASVDSSAQRFRSEAATLTSALRLARARAMRDVGGADHGVHYGDGCRLHLRCYVVFSGDAFDPLAGDNVEFAANSKIQVAWPGHDPVFRQLSGTATSTNITLRDGRRAAAVAIDYEGRIDSR